MLSVLHPARKALAILAGLVLTLTVTSCGPTTPTAPKGEGKVQVALLVPAGSGQAGDEILSYSLQNAARLAIADLQGVEVDLRVYNTKGDPAEAAVVAKQAVTEGAQIILGPVFAQEANAAGVAVAADGVNVLSFSNNPAIAGGNVFVLGPTFDNTAERLAGYLAKSGKSRVLIVHERNTAGEAGRAAIARGATIAGVTVVGEVAYDFSQSGVVAAAPQAVAKLRETGADVVFLTADTAGALPLISQLLIDNGLDPVQTRMVGLTRWDIPAETLALPGVQGGWFALPDPALYQQYVARYSATYGDVPHPISGLAYDGIAAIGALARQGASGPIPASALTQPAGFVGVNGVFRFLTSGINQRGLAIAEIQGGQVVVVDPAPRAFPGPGF